MPDDRGAWPRIEIVPERYLLSPGETVQGEVTIEATPFSTLRHLRLELIGEEIVGAFDFVFPLHTPVHREALVLEEGTIRIEGRHRFPFRFPLPGDLPPTYASERCRCHYFLVLRGEAPDRRRRPRRPLDPLKFLSMQRVGKEYLADAQLILIPPLLPPDPQPVKITASLPPLEIEACLPRDLFLPRDVVEGEFRIRTRESPPPKIESTTVSLIATETLAKNPRRAPVESPELVRIVSKESSLLEEGGEGVVRFQIQIPLDIPFTSLWKSFEVRWDLEIRLRLNRFREARLAVPIRIRKTREHFALL